MNRKVTGLAGAVGLAGFGTLVLVGYVQAAEDRALAGERLVPVLVVDDVIEQGTMAENLGAMVSTEQVPAKVRAAGAVGDLSELEGLAAAVDLLPGEQLVAARFAPAATVAPAGLPEGLDRLTISLAPERAVGGLVQAGSTVAVVASYDESQSGPARTEVVLRDVPVVGIGASGAVAAEEEGTTVNDDGSLLVTLGVEPDDVERILFGAEHGRIWLSGIDGLDVKEGVEP